MHFKYLTIQIPQIQILPMSQKNISQVITSDFEFTPTIFLVGVIRPEYQCNKMPTIKQCYLQIRGLCLSVPKKIYFTPNSLAEKNLIGPIK